MYWSTDGGDSAICPECRGGLDREPHAYVLAVRDGADIRPFVIADILRANLAIHWRKDRGKNPDGSERLNDLHATLAQKRAAREEAARSG